MKMTTNVICSAFSLFTLACFAVTSSTLAVDPPPDGGYPGDNTAEGDTALFSLTTGTDNTGIGRAALLNNTTGSGNTAIGAFVLYFNEDGGDNTAVGHLALFHGFSGYHNTAMGKQALFNNDDAYDNTAIGYYALGGPIGSNNIGVGSNAGVYLTGDNNIDIGNNGVAAESNTIRIGTQGTQTRTFIAGIRGTPITGGVAIGVNSSGQLGVRPSSARYKEAIQPMGKASEAILALKPVTFRYQKELDPQGGPQFGLVAEEVAKVNPDLVVADEQGKPFTVRYEEVNAMLLNEFLKEHRKVQDLKATVARQQQQIEALTAGLQKVNARLEVSRPAPQLARKNQ